MERGVSQVTTLVSTGLQQPGRLAVDGHGNVYFADTGNSAIKSGLRSANRITTPVSSGLNAPRGVTVTAKGTFTSPIRATTPLSEIVFAYLGPLSKSGGAHRLLTTPCRVLPARTPITPQATDLAFDNRHDRRDSLVFSRQSNSSAATRTAHINVLGQQIAITQSGAVPARRGEVRRRRPECGVPGQTFATLLQVTVAVFE